MTSSSSIEYLKQQIESIKVAQMFGRVNAVKGTSIECVGISSFVAIGSQCEILLSMRDGHSVKCEVVGFHNDVTILMPYSEIGGIGAGALVKVLDSEDCIMPDLSWAGRVMNAFCEPIDDVGPIKNGNVEYRLKNTPPSSSSRSKLGTKIDLGVKAIDVFTPCCYGQRLGIFAGSGVGKSVLISMLTKYASADIKIIGLVGERSREVKEFIDDYLGVDGLQNAIIIVATGDDPALLRRRAAYVTLCIAEYFRDQGKEVLCIIDSITRFAMAQREIGLAVGEPPTSKGYTPSVFAELPKLLERAGPGVRASGNITGLFTVLVEGDDHNEPISDAVRGILDGHIVLDRSIATRGRFPAVDVLKSVSRALPKCNSEEENAILTFARKMLAVYNDMSEMIRLGAYKLGTDKEVDMAISYYAEIENFLSQRPNETVSMSEAYVALAEIINSKNR